MRPVRRAGGRFPVMGKDHPLVASEPILVAISPKAEWDRVVRAASPASPQADPAVCRSASRIVAARPRQPAVPGVGTEVRSRRG